MKRLPALIAVLWAVFLITVLELYALSQGVNGTYFGLTLATIAGLAAGFAGFRVGRR